MGKNQKGEIMNQKTNKNQKQNLRPIPEEEMRQSVLKSGLCNELIAGVLTDQGEIPVLQNPAGQSGMGGEMPQENAAASGQTPQGLPSENPMSEEEFHAYMENCKKNCEGGELSMESLLCRIYDLVMQKNKLIQLLSQIQSGEAVIAAGMNTEAGGADHAAANPQMQMAANPQMQYAANPQMQMAANQQMQYGANPRMGRGMSRAESVPRSMGSTAQPAQKQAFIPKSQVEKMTREEIRNMFDVIDRSRKEW